MKEELEFERVSLKVADYLRRKKKPCYFCALRHLASFLRFKIRKNQHPC